MKTKNWTMNVAFGLLVTGVVSCGSGVPPARPSAGGAILEADAGKEHRNRIRGSKVIAVNGVRRGREEVHLAAGLTEAKVYYKWPQGGGQEVSLKFRAEKDRRYFVKYAAFPPNVDKLRGTTALSTTAEGFGGLSRDVMAAGVPNPMTAVLGTAVMAPGIVLGTVEFWSRVGADVADKRKPAQWVDMMVISEKEAEGVVRFVRVYPSGKVEWKPWDAASNAPGHAQRGRVVRPGPGSEVNDQVGATFHRRESVAE
jgi:hypothetical protein